MTRESALLAAAADLIEAPGAWTQHTSARAASGRSVAVESADAVCWCMSGALCRVSRTVEDAQALGHAAEVLRLSLGERSIAGFNDAKGRTQAEAVAELRLAAAKADA